MSDVVERGHCYTVRRVTASKRHYCSGMRHGLCKGIKPGDVYLLHTEFPGGDSGWAERHPVSLRECAQCVTDRDRAELLAAPTTPKED